MQRLPKVFLVIFVGSCFFLLLQLRNINKTPLKTVEPIMNTGKTFGYALRYFSYNEGSWNSNVSNRFLKFSFF